MIKKVKYILITCILTLSLNVNAQLDTLQSVLKPRIGVGTGPLTYFGEVQNYQIGGFSTSINRIAASLYINAPLSRSFNLEFSTMYGKLGANERTLARNYNFESRIRSGSVMLHYNFYQVFGNSNRYFSPLLGVGFTSFEFLSKTDMFDANGNMYYYWSDGSIMSLDENDPLANTAKPMYRDYVYETDLREQNYDSLGKYREQSFAIPITLGFEWHLTPRVDFRAAATINYTFTDLIDNISPAGDGIRKGDDKKDYYMYTSASISYDLEFGKNNGENNTNVFDEPAVELDEFDQSDLDHDGVIDAFDDCPRTPLEAVVDEHGCPIDTDKDGVADYFDEEENTPIGNYVDQYGVTIPESVFRRQMEIFLDSTGLIQDYDKDFKHTDFRDQYGNVVKGKKEKDLHDKTFVVIIGKEHKNISANELHKYLGYNDFKTLIKGDTVFYVLGEYDNIEDAVAAKTSLESDGVEVELIGKSNTANDTTLQTINKEIIDKVEKINYETGKELPTFTKTKKVFRVQVGAFKNKIDAQKLFPNLDSLTFAKGKDGLTRYYSGTFNNPEDAKTELDRIKALGYKKAFVVAYQNHERITLKEAGVSPLPNNYNEKKEIESFVEPRQNDNNSNQNGGISNPSINMAKVKYRVELGRFESAIPVETIDIFMSIGGIRPVKSTDGATTYYSRSVTSETEAKQMLEEYKQYDLKGLKVVYEYEGKYYSKAEFLKLK